MSDDILTRRWNHVLDTLTAYLARELTPSEEALLAELITFWNSVPREHVITAIPAGCKDLTITFGHIEDAPLSEPLNDASRQMLTQLMNARIDEDAILRAPDE